MTLTHSQPATRQTDPHPEFLEMVGRLAGAYCPPLLTTDVVEIARTALVGRGADEMHEVEAVARAALDTAVAHAGGRHRVEHTRRGARP